MSTFQVSETDYQIIASIFKIGKSSRRKITWGQFVKVMDHVGYTYGPGAQKGKGRTSTTRCRFEPKDGKGPILRFRAPHKKRDPLTQDDLKHALENILGWSETSFVLSRDQPHA